MKKFCYLVKVVTLKGSIYQSSEAHLFTDIDKAWAYMSNRIKEDRYEAVDFFVKSYIFGKKTVNGASRMITLSLERAEIL